MIKELLIVFCLFSKILSIGQGISELDSLKEIIGRSKNQEEIVNNLNELGFRYCFLSTDSAFKYLIEANSQAVLNQYEKGEAESLFNLGIASSMIGENAEALQFMKESHSIFKSIGDSTGLARVSNGLGNVFRFSGNLPEALYYFLQSLKIKEKIDAPLQEIAGSYIGIGSIQTDMEDLDQAITSFRRSLDMFLQIQNQKGIAAAATNLGYTYQEIGKFQESINTLNIAYEAEKAGGNIEGMIQVLSNLGDSYLKIGDYLASESFLSEALSKSRETGINRGMGAILLKMSQLHFAKGEVDQALGVALDALDNYEYPNSQTLSELYLTISDLYRSNESYEEAYGYYTKHIELRDSLFSKDADRKMIRLQTQYEFDKKEESLKAEQQQNEYKLEQRNQRNLIVSVALGTLILSIAAFIYFQYRQRNKYAKVVEEKNDQLLETMASKEKLFSVIAHDLKSPLSAFTSISSTLAENIDAFQKDQIVTYLKKFEKSSQNLSELLNNLLEWSLSQTGSLSVRKEELEIRKSIDNAIKPLTDLAESKSIQLIVEGEPLYVQADAKMIETVIRNLVSNALKFTGSGGVVTLSSKMAGKNVLVAVKDSGVGMTEEEASRLFDVRFDPSSIGDHEEKGTGLGLILSKELIEKNSGTIGVESEQGKGSTFYFTIPNAA